MSEIIAGYELRKWHPDKGDEVLARSHDLRSLDAAALDMNNALEPGDETQYHVEDASQPLFKPADNAGHSDSGC